MSDVAFVDGANVPFVTEAPGLHTTVIKDIHHIAIDGEDVRIFTIDKIPHPGGIEHRVNGDFLIKRSDLIRMMGHVTELLYRSLADQATLYVRERLSALRQRCH